VRSEGVSPTRRASRATLPARGREANGASRRIDQSLMQVVVYEFFRFAYAVPSLCGEGGSRSQPWVNRREYPDVQQ
jgi:hypothetical protein